MVTTASPGKCLVYSYVQERSGLYTQEYRKRGSAHRRCYGAIFASSYSAQTFYSRGVRDLEVITHARWHLGGFYCAPRVILQHGVVVWLQKQQYFLCSSDSIL